VVQDILLICPVLGGFCSEDGLFCLVYYKIVCLWDLGFAVLKW
jgi:hypothetical protein